MQILVSPRLILALMLSGCSDCCGDDTGCDGTGPACTETGVRYLDVDGDGHGGAEIDACKAGAGAVPTGGDCDDGDEAVFPGAEEACNGRDDNCDGEVDEAVMTVFYFDGDEDGFGTASQTQVACDRPAGFVEDAADCDDDNAEVNPDAIEVCNTIDDDCDGWVDDGDDSLDTSTGRTFYADVDGDAFGDPRTPVLACEVGPGRVEDFSDCDDGDAAIHPGATEI